MAHVIHPGNRTTMKSTAVTAVHRFIKFDGSICGAGELSYGVTEYGATAAGKALDVVLDGEVLIELGGTVADGAKVESDATGRAVTLSTGEFAGIIRAGGGVGQLGLLKIG